MTSSVFIHTITQSCILTIDIQGTHIILFENVSGEIVCNLMVPDTRVLLYGIYRGFKKDIYNIRTVQHHRAPRTTSDLLVKGVFRDNSHFIYEGLVKIDPGCNGSHAYQKNQNLLVSSETCVVSQPFLEIESPDVFCTHGSTTGSVDILQCMYLQMRGIDLDTAREMVIAGFLQDMQDSIDKWVAQGVPYPHGPQNICKYEPFSSQKK